MRALDDSRFRFAVLTLGLFTVLAGDVWRYSITWYGFGAIVLAVSVFSALLLVRHRQDWRIGTLPYPLLAFLALSTVSVFWSFYPGATAVGLAANWLTVLSGVAFAVAFDWATPSERSRVAQSKATANATPESTVSQFAASPTAVAPG
jgi:exopolysaccharide production protein ExoQ